jgi:glycyl-radical enzyme activating protein
VNETAVIFDIQRASLNDGPGIRTTVFFKGCPLECLWCHNPEALTHKKQLFFFYEKCQYCGKCESVCENNVHKIINNTHTIDYDSCVQCGKCVNECNSKSLKITGAEMSVDEIMVEVLADMDFYTNSNGGVTLSGGEPLMHFSFAMKLLKRCKQKGINTCIETSGFVASTKFKEILPFVDTLLFDYKITATKTHKEYTGVTNETILTNLDFAYNTGTDIVVRCPIIPGINDTEEHFKGIRSLDIKYPKLKGIELLPYHSIGNNKRTSLGVETTLAKMQTTSPEMAGKWLDQLKKLKCEKVKIA